ncbi:MAG: Gmad2 immunoglobulin-like domain-containing protein [Actinobacteria bacterium]|nr:Gmad2 immunoglobulin-like domain-containing protein [Actinomycetota bacterium]
MKEKIINTLLLVFFVSFIFILSSCLNINSADGPAGSKPDSANESESMPQEEQDPTEIEAGSVETETASGDETGTAEEDSLPDLIRVTSPEPDEMVSSPLLVKGEARGTWFFEATFPVKLIDADGNIILSHYAGAEGEWMTKDFVPFSAELIFENPPVKTGILVLERNNPSDLPENDASITIPVKFGKNEKTVEDCDPIKGEYFAGAILLGIDNKNNIITVKQLFNEPNEKTISPDVALSEDCKIVKSILIREPEEKEIVSEITLDEIPVGSEIGILFKPDNTARAIIYQIMAD